LTDSLTLLEQTGQMLVSGFHGTTLIPETERLIRDHRIGGLILFERNYENPRQLHRLIRDLQTLALATPPHLPLFISVDQEGGRVARLKAPFTQFPFPCCLGEARSEELAQRFAEALGRELAVTGINVDYAPVLDVHSNPQNPIIGNRALSRDPEWTARLGVAFLRGFRNAGVLAVGKHFPGHGDTAQDSHLELPTVSRPAADLEAVELVPFARAISAGLDIIMTAHVNYPAWDEKYPATFSRAIMTDILRKRLGFDGVIISDDLEMKAVANHFSFDSLPTLATDAGVDQLLICHGIDKIPTLQDGMMANAKAGRIPAETIHRSVQRIIKLKRCLPPVPSAEPDFAVFAEEHRCLAETLAAHLQ
jgi:beta-N-acetylhexosaminidase